MNIIHKRSNPMSLFDDVVRDFFDSSNIASNLLKRNPDDLFPVFDLVEKEKSLVVHAELPGVAKEDVEVSLKNNILTIHGTKKKEAKKEEEQYLWIERSYGEFSRSIKLPDHIDAENIEASYKDGVLELNIPKAESAQPKKIEIKS